MNKRVWELVVKKYKTRKNIENFLIDLAVNTTILATSLIIIYIIYRLKWRRLRYLIGEGYLSLFVFY